MKKLLSIFLMGLLVFTFSSQITHASDYAPVDVTVTSHFDVINETVNNVNGNSYGTTLKLENSLGSAPDYSFAYWAINDVLQPSLSPDCDFDVTSDMTIDAYYTKTSEHLAIFVDSNGNVLHFEHVVDHGIVGDPSMPIPDKPGMTVADPKWDNSLIDITEDTIYVLQYENDSTHNTSDLAVALTTTSDAVLVGAGTYMFNEEITVTAPATNVDESLNFSHWSDTETGQILSYNSDYMFTVLSARTIEAIYTGPGSTPVNVIALTDVVEMREGFYTYVSQFEVLDGFYALEYGIITNSVNGDFDLQTEGISRYQADKVNPDTNEFVLSIQKDHYAIRAYLVVRDNLDNLSVVYSDVINYEMPTPDLFISEYYEGSSYNKYIEIYNPTGETVILSEYLINYYSNGSSTPSNFTFDAATLGAGEVYVFYNSQASQEIKDAGNQSSGAANFNGDDAVALVKNGTVIDIVGQTDGDPGSSWPCGTGSTANYTLVRNNDVTIGTNSWDTTEWTVYPVDTWDYLGVHPGLAPDMVSPTINGTNNSSIAVESSFDALNGVTANDNVDGDVSASLTFDVHSGEIALAEGVTSYDFSTLSAGDYTINYHAEDAASNEGTVDITLTITAAGEPTALFTTDFESISTGTSYNSVTTKGTAPNTWTMYGNISTTGAIDGRSIHMRWYGSTTPFAETDFKVTDPGSMVFYADSDADVDVTVEYSFDGETWLGAEHFVTQSEGDSYDSKECIYNFGGNDVTGDVHIRFTYDTTGAAIKDELHIDDITIYSK
jgi:hypothetical protein